MKCIIYKTITDWKMSFLVRGHSKKSVIGLSVLVRILILVHPYTNKQAREEGVECLNCGQTIKITDSI